VARVFTMDALAKCAEQDVTNKFDMIVLGSYYARQLRKGKPTIVNALRDFESGEVDLKALQDEYVESKQKEKKPTPSTDEEEK